MTLIIPKVYLGYNKDRILPSPLTSMIYINYSELSVTKNLFRHKDRKFTCTAWKHNCVCEYLFTHLTNKLLWDLNLN